ncbi:hypothetical protein OF83DRAFT_1167511 [Amylostereum chailletii]|nr:hypothetical protein OF83DRAFT_1167511 [Amylostereum chailletii]
MLGLMVPTRTETTPLNRPPAEVQSGPVEAKPRKRPLRAYMALMIFSILSFCVFSMGMQVERLHNTVEHQRLSRQWERDRLEHERQKREWEVERQESRREWERERERITQERLYEQEEHERARRQWERERQGHQAERESWERERREREREREGERPYWGPLAMTSSRCLSYDTREYTARLFDILPTGAWHTTCMSTPQGIHGRSVSPTRCEDHASGPDGGVVGYWIVSWDEAECRPHWERFWDKGCVRPGLRRWEGQLYSFRPEDDKFEMCQSTPAVLPDGQLMKRADYCDDRVCVLY